jgi:hypothetical protein
MEGMFVKMWDPPTENPATPDEILPNNPVPEVLVAAGIAVFLPGQEPPPHTMQLDLLHGMTLPAWDNPNKDLNFFTLVNPDIPQTANGTYPGTTIRTPCGAVFHCKTSGKGPPPHTIHWHGMEPTPMNDGVGHCSMEIGGYTYQWQPTFLGTYFYHCHRNTMQHFEFGLFGLLLVEPADAYFVTLVDPTIPIGHCRDGKRRTGANLQSFPQFPDWQGGERTDPDPWAGDPAMRMENLNPQIGNINPHAQTVPYDVEALWVFDDRDSNWSENASDARATFPRHGSHPGYDDDFTRNPGRNGFFAFNDYHADYWFCTGVPVECAPGGTADIPPGVVVPAELNSGISGSQVSIEAYIGQTILIRCLDAAYNNCRYTFPMDIVIIEWDGRPLGVPPYGYNHAYLVPANTPINVAVGRRFGALLRFFSPVSTFAVCEFIDTRGAYIQGFEVVTCTARVPINISPLTITATSDKASPQPAGTSITFTAAMPGTPNGNNSLAPTSGPYEYQFWLKDTAGAYTLVKPFSASNTWNWATAGIQTGTYSIAAQMRTVGSTAASGFDAETVVSFAITPAAVTQLDVAAAPTSPRSVGTAIAFTATAAGGGGTVEYQFWLKDTAGVYTLAQPFSAANVFNWNTNGLPAGTYTVAAQAKNSGTNPPNGFDVESTIAFALISSAATTLDVVTAPDSPSAAGTAVSFTATAGGAAGPFEYRFWLKDTAGVYTLAQAFSSSQLFNWDTTGLTAGTYAVAAQAKAAGSSPANGYDVEQVVGYVVLPAPATTLNIVTTPNLPQVTFAATAGGAPGPFEYQFWLKDTLGVYTLVQDYSSATDWIWDTTGFPAGTYSIAAHARSVGSGSSSGFDVETVVSFTL